MKSEIQVFREYLRRHNLLRTTEREQILQEVFAIHGHFDVDELHLRLKNKHSKVSKASIYRALPLLIECGLVLEVDFSDGHWHYEHIYGHAHHSHLRCLGCGEILEFEEPALRMVEEQLARQYGYRIKGHKLQVHGYCGICQEAE